MKFGYHNHDFEFNTQIDGKKLYDLIFSSQILLSWSSSWILEIYIMERSAIDIVKQYPGRFESMHVKDESKQLQKRKIWKYYSWRRDRQHKRSDPDAGKSNGTIHFIIEQESYQGKDSVHPVRKILTLWRNGDIKERCGVKGKGNGKGCEVKGKRYGMLFSSAWTLWLLDFLNDEIDS